MRIACKARLRQCNPVGLGELAVNLQLWERKLARRWRIGSLAGAAP